MFLERLHTRLYTREFCYAKAAIGLQCISKLMLLGLDILINFYLYCSNVKVADLIVKFQVKLPTALCIAALAR